MYGSMFSNVQLYGVGDRLNNNCCGSCNKFEDENPCGYGICSVTMRGAFCGTRACESFELQAHKAVE